MSSMPTQSIHHSQSTRWFGLLVALAVCFAAAALGTVANVSEIRTWYVTLDKPSWTPPNWVFGPVWTILYALMAISAWIIWDRLGWRRAQPALALFGGQLLLNVAWSWLFFNQHSPGLAFADIAALWIAIAATLSVFARTSATAAGLLVPYLLWVTYAAALNYAIWMMN